MSAIRDFLRQRLEAGEWSLGQVSIRPGILLRHIEDRNRNDLEAFTYPEDARELAKYDEAGGYRPLKTAPNLRRGWEIRLSSIEELHRTLDFFYPAALGAQIAHACGKLSVTSLRETLARQSGMYRVTRLITDDQARGLVQEICARGCLRRRLWTISGNRKFEDSKSEIEDSSILCAEACNLFVAACRPQAKQNLPKPG